MRWRLALWAGLVIGWLVMLLYLWSAFATLPSPERLEQARTVRIPTLRTVAVLVVRSAVELAAVLALLWPWSRRYYEVRMFAAGSLLTGWFLATTPLAMATVDWVHRRWLAAMVVVLMTGLLAALTERLLVRTRHRLTRDT